MVTGKLNLDVGYAFIGPRMGSGYGLWFVILRRIQIAILRFRVRFVAPTPYFLELNILT